MCDDARMSKLLALCFFPVIFFLFRVHFVLTEEMGLKEKKKKKKRKQSPLVQTQGRK